MAREGRYDTILRVRQRQEELRAAALAEVRREIRVLEEQRDEIVRQQRAMIEQAQAAMRQECRASDVQGYYGYERFLARLAVEKDARLAELRRIEAQRRDELEAAYKSRRIMEKLSEKERDAFLAAAGKKEQAVLDETAVNHAALSRSGVGS